MMARKVEDDDRELWDVAFLLLTAVKVFRKHVGGKWADIDRLIRRAEAALKARPQ
jgi:hypothetical protein